jgi:DNA-binding NarL/FixJ family response regulator
LFISDKAVSVHVTHLLRKLDVTSRREATEIAKRTGVATA